MPHAATRLLARYAVELRARDIPSEVYSKAKDCLLDILTVSLYGSTKPWSKQVVQHVSGLGVAGHSTIIAGRRRAPAHLAALANGTMAHAFELDNVRQPGGGVHPGATAFLPALAVAEAQRSDGRAFLTACVAACEVMSRIGVAAGNSLERRGFHAPGVTGTFGAAVAAGRLLGLDESKMINALGIAGSYCGGLMEFSRCAQGAMIKRLHLGRAAEGGVTAAYLARRGFAGPESILEGKFGVCRTFSDSPELSRLTHRLGRDFESLNICIKRYACHINAHAPIEALESIARDNGIKPQDIGEIVVAGGEKLVTHHAIYRPENLMSAQYSIPFCIALSLFHDPKDPESFTDQRMADRNVLATMRRIRVAVDSEVENKGWERAARVTVSLKDGRRFSKLVVHFRGTPHNPMSATELEDKARNLTRRLFGEKKLARLLETVRGVEKLDRIGKLTRVLSIAS